MILRRTTLLAPLVLLARCGSSPPPPVLTLTIQTGPDQNPDSAGHPAPVAIRIYQLASLAAFSRADVFALIDRQAETLGADYLASDEVVVARRTTDDDARSEAEHAVHWCHRAVSRHRPGDVAG